MRKILESSPALLVFFLWMFFIPNSRGWIFYLYIITGSFLFLWMVAKPSEYLEKQENRIKRLEVVVDELNKKLNKE